MIDLCSNFIDWYIDQLIVNANISDMAPFKTVGTNYLLWLVHYNVVKYPVRLFYLFRAHPLFLFASIRWTIQIAWFCNLHRLLWQKWCFKTKSFSAPPLFLCLATIFLCTQYVFHLYLFRTLFCRILTGFHSSSSQLV